MLDTQLQERFARRCTDAAFGYTAATTAAYAAFSDQVLDFWAGVLKTDQRAAPAPQMTWGWPLPMTAAAPRQELAPVPFMPFPWAAPQSRSVPVDNPFAVANAAFSTWLGMFPYTMPSPAWPMAFMMIVSGVPRSVAWPAAEANIAVMDAAEAATVSVQKVLASYCTNGGHAVSREQWPTAHLMMFAMLVPLNIGALLGSLRMG